MRSTFEEQGSHPWWHWFWTWPWYESRSVTIDDKPRWAARVCKCHYPGCYYTNREVVSLEAGHLEFQLGIWYLVIIAILLAVIAVLR